MTRISPSYQPSRQRIARLLMESLANLIARPGLAVLLVAITVGLAEMPVVSETNSAVANRTYDRQLALAGYSVLSVSATDGVTLTAANCLSLHGIHGVLAALWLAKAQPAEWYNSSGPVVAIRQVGGDISTFLAITNPGRVSRWDGAPLLVDIASSVVDGKDRPFPVRFQLDGGPLVATTAFPVELTMFGQGLQGNAVVISARAGPSNSPPTEIESCLLITDEELRAQVPPAIPGVFPPSQGYSAQWVLTNADSIESPKRRFEQRQTQWAWLLSGLTFVALWGIYLRLRRSEIAVYAVAGLRTGHLTILAGAELIIILGLGVGFAGAVFLFDALRYNVEPSDISVGLQSGARFVILALAGGLAVTISRGSEVVSATLDSLQDR